jgi:hypothetical protein
MKWHFEHLEFKTIINLFGYIEMNLGILSNTFETKIRIRQIHLKQKITRK